jgi:fructose-bisphosphate aldolase class 1
MDVHELNAIARSIISDHKGVIAADETTWTKKKRFYTNGI